MYYSYCDEENWWRNNTLILIKEKVLEENQYEEPINERNILGELIAKLKSGDYLILPSIMALKKFTIADMVDTLRYIDKIDVNIISEEEPNLNTKGCCELFDILENWVDFEDLDD